MRNRIKSDRETKVLIGVWVGFMFCGGFYFVCALIANVVTALTTAHH